MRTSLRKCNLLNIAASIWLCIEVLGKVKYAANQWSRSPSNFGWPEPKIFRWCSRNLQLVFLFHRQNLWGKRVVQIMQWFLFFNGPNSSGPGAKNFQMLQSEPKNWNAWNRSTKFEFRLHSPAANSWFALRVSSSWGLKRTVCSAVWNANICNNRLLFTCCLDVSIFKNSSCSIVLYCREFSLIRWLRLTIADDVKFARITASRDWCCHL